MKMEISMAKTTETPLYYVPEQSKLPVLTALALFCMLIGGGNFIKANSHQTDSTFAFWWMLSGFAMMAVIFYAWFGQVIRENDSGLYSDQLNRSFVMGMSWFIFSEVMFFAAFFGALFYVRTLVMPWLAGEGDKGVSHMLWPDFQAVWPMINMPSATGFSVPSQVVDPWHLPLINTILLVSSSVTLTWAHHALKVEQRSKLNFWLFVTVALGVSFLVLQAYEYYEAYHHYGLTLNSGIYGTTFFMLTGFHGAHVTIGTLMLIVMLLRALKGHFKPNDHFGFEAAAWYWHFVDVVWVGLFIFVYLW